MPQPLEQTPELLAKLKAAPNMQAAWAMVPDDGKGAGTMVAGAGGGAGGGSAAPAMQPLSPMQNAMSQLGSLFSSLPNMSGGGGEIVDTPDPAPIRTMALQGLQTPQMPDYLGSRNAAVGALYPQPAGSDMPGGELMSAESGITQGAPSMSALTSGETSGLAGTGAPMTGVGAVSPLTFPTSMSRYSRLG
jgi:hypothetical protein